MPAGNYNTASYIGSQSSIAAMNVVALYKPGELGSRVSTPDGKVFQIVQCDSGPTSVAVGDVAFWKTKSTYVVTNKQVDASELRNAVAGVFTAVVTPGYYCAVQISGRGKVKCTSNSGAGDFFVANTGTASDAAVVALGTAATCIPLGISPTAQAPASSISTIDLIVGDSATNT